MNELQEILIQEYQKKKQSIVSPVDLLEMIESVMSDVLETNLLTERPKAKPGQQEFPFGKEYFQDAESLEFTYRAIPEIPVSELGWASLESNDEGTRAKRQQLEQFLSRIKGENFKTKLNNLNEMLNDPSKFIQSGKIQAKSPGERIALILAYLIFFKTLTTIITNFNAASAGFNFESFLGVLLGGGQIATGNKTIADLKAAARPKAPNGIPISLKLYGADAVKVGGSYTDLVNDLVNASSPSTGTGQGSYMQYVVATKDLTGEGLQTEGVVTFYRFNLTLENIFQIFASSRSGSKKLNQTDIRLPKVIVDGDVKLDKAPKPPRMPDMQILEKIFMEASLRAIPDLPEQLFQAINYAKSPHLFSDIKKGGAFRPGTGGTKLVTWHGSPSPGRDADKQGVEPGELGFVAGGAPLLNVLRATARAGFINPENFEKIWNSLYVAHNEALQKVHDYTEELARIKVHWSKKKGDFASAKQSLIFYNSLPPSLQQRALLYSYGYQHRKQFELVKGDIYDIARLAGSYKAFGTQATGTEGQDEVQIGWLRIGRQEVQDMLNEVITETNAAVFEIFNNLKTLNDSLQQYFAGALEDPEPAETAIKAASDISTKTEEIKTDI